ncbi:hypothetical protein PR048_004372 [Dryococelus australis]|uniref:Uncharacterized protein n=1 Tax=Dryococelus australis TaxID=614101 RepID=A0ABQ9I772_9NEOP|nr:hypothetical protein PR048_004372 [Dryococelus australis]
MVCKMSFMSIHGLKNHRGRVNNTVSKLKAHVGTPTLDQRGRHQNRPKRCSDEAISGVHDNIKAIPKYKSHYSRFQNPQRVYLGNTCKTCDSFQCLIDNGSEREKPAAPTAKELHLRYADSLKSKLEELSDLAKEDPTIHVISVDLQQTLPTSKLSCGPAFYSRELWIYNEVFTIVVKIWDICFYGMKVLQVEAVMKLEAAF